MRILAILAFLLACIPAMANEVTVTNSAQLPSPQNKAVQKSEPKIKFEIPRYDLANLR